MSSRLVKAVCGCLALGCLVPACEVPSPNRPTSFAIGGDQVPLPYQGPVRGLFDDGIDPSLFGADDNVSDDNERRLNERMRSSSLVVVVQVTTVSDEANSGVNHLELEVEPVEKPILGSYKSDDQPLRLTMSSGTASYALAQSNQRDLVGKRIILCVGQFLDNGQTVVHWHGLPANEQTRKAVERAASIADLEK